MRIESIIIGIILSVICLSAGASEPDSLEFTQIRLRANENQGAELRCRLVLNQERLRTSIGEASIVTNDFPTIDWASSLVVLISPQLYLQNYRPSVIGLSARPATLIVEWDLIPEGPDLAESSVSSRTEDGVRYTVTTQGSTGIGPEALLVVTDRKNLTKRKVVCRGPKKTLR